MGIGEAIMEVVVYLAIGIVYVMLFWMIMDAMKEARDE